MQKYLFRRLLLFIPTLWLVTLMGFYLSKLAPGDPVALALGEADQDRVMNEGNYIQKRKELALDKPVFYFSIAALSESDTLYKIHRPQWRDLASYLTFYTGNWNWVNSYLSKIKDFKNYIGEDSTLSDKRAILLSLIEQLTIAKDSPSIFQVLNKIESTLKFSKNIQFFQELKSHVQNLEISKTLWKNYIPVIHFHGLENQYHQWLIKALQLDFGISYVDQRPIHTKIKEALFWTVIINFFSIIIIYGLGIYIGVIGASNYGSRKEKILSHFTLILFSLPTFWVGSMMIMFLGAWLKIFPVAGVQSIANNSNWSLFQRLLDWSHHLILPVICLSYSSIAFLSKQMQNAMLETLSQDFIQTAKSKGIKKKQIIWKHAFKNSLFPMITFFAQIFPTMVSGSIIVETIFSLPGMGFLLYQSIYARDYPVMIAVFTLSGFMTILGILLSDILYKKMDPRVQFEKY